MSFLILLIIVLVPLTYSDARLLAIMSNYLSRAKVKIKHKMKTIFENQEVMVIGLRPMLSLKWNLSKRPHLPCHHFLSIYNELSQVLVRKSTKHNHQNFLLDNTN